MRKALVICGGVMKPSRTVWMGCNDTLNELINADILEYVIARTEMLLNLQFHGQLYAKLCSKSLVCLALN